MSDPPADRAIEDPLEISGFELQRRLGAGGMAEVFLANKRGAEGTYKQLVVKRILPEHSSSRRFRHMFVEEAHLATRLNHPNIVQVYEFSHHEDDLLLSMEYVDGGDLGQLMRAARKQHKRIPYWVSAFVISEVAKGLHYAHERKDEGGLPLAIVHRDVSPQNVLLSSGGVVKIADFGIASANLFREETGVLKGKFSYMSPEQARGERVDRRSDIYGLGVVFYELVCGKSPYGQLKDQALADAVRHGAVKSPAAEDPDIPEVLVEIVMQTLQRDPDKRFQTARALSSAVARAMMQNQQLIDNGSVEETMTWLLGTSSIELAEQQADLDQQTMAAGRRARTAHESSSGTARDYLSLRIVREVRHVAVVQLRLEGREDLERVQGSNAAARSIEQLRATLNDIVYKRGAVMTWESSEQGNTILGLGSNPSRAPNDAALLAVDIHEFLSSHSEDLPVPVRASVAVVRGIATGERDGQGHLGNHTLNPLALYLADQLSGRTPFGKTWVAGGVYRLLRREFRWSDGPTLELAEAEQYADAPEKVRVYALLRPLTSDERIAEMAANPTDLVGREAEKADLQAAFHRAANRPSTAPPPGDSDTPPRGEMVSRLVIGEMGIGKTALLNQFVAELDERTLVFQVECSPVNIDLPYSAAAAGLRLLTGITTDDDLSTARATLKRLANNKQQSNRVINALAEMLTGTDPKVQDEDAAIVRQEMIIRGVQDVVGAMAEKQPIVIIMDSAQWADTPSLLMIRGILRNLRPMPVLSVIVTRPDDRVEPIYEGVVRVELTGLSPDDQVRLVQTRLGVHTGVESVCRELVPRVGGNPYFLLEMIDALLEKGALEIVDSEEFEAPVLVRDDTRFDEHADALPSTIEQLVGDRLAELPSAEHDVVDWLAVAGGPLSDTDLMALARLTNDEPITRLCARGLCDRRNNDVDFRHPLARDVAYNELELVNRARMHRRLGEHYADTHLAQGVSAAIVAQHFERGEAPQQAAELFLEAAKAARAAHQTQLALRYFQRTLQLLPPGDPRVLLAHEALERIFRFVGQQHDRKRHLEALRRDARASRQARWIAVALVRTAQLDLDEGAMARGLPVAQRAADMARFAKQPELEVEALVLLCELLRDLGDVNGALDACERALRAAEAGKVSRRARGEVLRTKGVLLRRAGRPNAAVETHAEAIAIFGSTGARRSEARARNALGFALFVLGRYEDCIAMCLSSLSLDVMVGGRYQVAKTLTNIGMSYARLGDLDRGMAYLDRARDAHEQYDDYDGRVDTLLVTATMLLENGLIDRAQQLFKDASALVTVSGTIYDRIHQLVVTALLAREQGDPPTAATAASEARQLAEGQALVSYHVYATALEAVARVDNGDTQSGVLLATTALGAVEAMEGSEYGIEVRSLCCEAVIQALSQDKLTGSTPAMTADVCRRALNEVDKIAGYIRDAELRDMFLNRAPVKKVVDNATRFARGDEHGVLGNSAEER